MLLPTKSDYLEDSGCLALNYADLFARSDRSSLREGAPSWILLQLFTQSSNAMYTENIFRLFFFKNAHWRKERRGSGSGVLDTRPEKSDISARDIFLS